MNVLIVGGGGREHAIAWALSKSEQVEQLYCAPGNGGIAALAQCVPSPPPTWMEWWPGPRPIPLIL